MRVTVHHLIHDGDLDEIFFGLKDDIIRSFGKLVLDFISFVCETPFVVFQPNTLIN